MPEPNGQICGHCLQQAPHFDATLAVFDFRFPVDAVLRRYKYRGQITTAELLGTLLAERATGSVLPDVLIPMPLHRQRLRQRGFNQAVEIARVAARRLSLPLLPRAVLRLRATPPQAGLSLAERRRNLQGAFACQQDLGSRHVALVDDVMTSGSSLDALARTVRAAGATRVDCWVVARTLRE